MQLLIISLLVAFFFSLIFKAPFVDSSILEVLTKYFVI